MSDAGPFVIDCPCKRRYFRMSVALEAVEHGNAQCACGEMLGAWNGAYRFEYEPEEAERGDA